MKKNRSIRPRQHLIGEGLRDIVVIICVYNIVFRYYFGYVPWLSGSVVFLAVIWLAVSYVCGRYNSTTKANSLNILIVASVVMIFTMLSVWLGFAEDRRPYPEFIVPLISAIGGASWILDYLECKIEGAKGEPNSYIVVSTDNEYLLLKDELAKAKMNIRLEQSIQNLSEAERTNVMERSGDEGILMSSSVKICDENLEKMLEEKSKGRIYKNIVQWCEEEIGKIPPELVDSHWLLLGKGFVLRPGQAGWRVKRLGDLVVASVLMLASLPLIVIVAVMIKIDDGGKVFYRQVRTGLYGKRFRIVKLRSMHEQAEADGAIWAIKDDVRITRVGKWLRKYRIDELPQLYNVFCGEMSLIGPRPERPEIEKSLVSEIPHYRTRHWIRPGISGWAQVQLPYGASVEEAKDKLGYDLYYMKNYSIKLDFEILVRTILLILCGKGAVPDNS
jgi:lipopolysaccharide/colanic/teichoic acid biosynthesis glycosyltransferase